MLKHALISHIFIVVQIFYFTFSEDPKSYGKFSLKLQRFDICKGPKKVDCAHLTADIHNDTAVTLRLTIDKDVIPNRGKVVSMMNNKPVFRLQMKSPCSHLFMKPLFQAILNASQSCEFKKGNYIINLDLEAVSEKYYGGMFIYGNMSFKSLFYNDECNFSCAVTEVIFYPKKNINNN